MKMENKKSICFGIMAMFGLLLAVSLAYASVFSDSTSSDFNNGTYQNTLYNGTFVVLSGANLTGNYTSRIFNAGGITAWNNISWTAGGYYQQELPNNQEAETGMGGANMAKNVLLLHMNEASGAIIDYSGNANNCTTYNGVTYGAAGKLNSALSFNGINNGIVINQSPSLDTGPSVSMGIWFYARDCPIQPSPEDYDEFILAKTNSGGYNRGIWGNGTCQIYIQPGTLTAASQQTNVTYSLNQWNHMVVNFYQSGSNVIHNIYINGILKDNYTYSSVTMWYDAGDYQIGADQIGRYFNGTIDEVAVWNRSLGTNEILNIYKRGALKLNLTARSCDDSACSGESFSDINDISSQNLSVANNSYFQYKFEFLTDNASYSPELYNVTISYELPDLIPPGINFTNPTPANGTLQSATSVYVNVSTSDANAHYTFTDFNRGLRGWWRLGQGNGTFFIDDSGKNNGTCSNCPTFDSSGVFNGSYSFDSAQLQYIQAAYNSDINFSNNDEMTISLWFKYRNSQSAGLLSNRAASSSSYNLYLSSTSLILDIANSTTHQTTSSYPVSTNTWYHVVATYNGSIMSLYVNGTLVRTQNQTGNIQYQTTAMQIGRYQASYLNGSLDEILVFNRSLSASEAAALYNATANQYYNNFTNLGDGSYSYKAYAVDSAGNKNNTETRTIIIQLDTTPPAYVTGLVNQSSGYNWIYWNWTNPSDADFSQAIVYIDSVNIANTSNNYYNATGLSSETNYTITIHTKDTNGNVNNTDVNSTARTLDITPPSSITGLNNQSAGRTWIYWNWTNPSDADFSQAIVYINSVNVANTSNNYYNATGLTCNSNYTITIHTKDTSNNINNTDINDSAITSICNSDPVVTTLTITPATAYTNDDLNCTFVVTDNDAGDSLTANYTWYNGTNAVISGIMSVANGTQYSIILKNENTTKGEIWNCSIIPYDEHYYGAAKSSTRTISNTLPTAPVVDVLPNIPNDNNDLAVSITTSSSDADNDSISYSYQWYKNSISQAGQTSTTLSNLLTSAGEIWKCVVTPNDGTGNGATGEDSVTINGTSATYAINLVSPTNGATWSSSDNVTFEYNTTLEASNCSLIINGAITEIDNNVTTNATETFTTILSNAVYSWSVNCTDINNTTNSSAIWALTVSYLYCGDGSCNNGETCSSCSADCGGCSSGGGGGGTRRIVNNTANVSVETKTNITKFEFGVPGIEIEQVSSVIANPGESKKISLNVKNSGTAFLNKCKLSGSGDYSSWITTESVKDLSIGQEIEFLFSLDLPKEAQVGRYDIVLSVICQEITKDSNINVEVIQKRLAVKMIDATRLKDGNLRINYSLAELTGEMQEVDVQIILVGSNGLRIAETNEKRIVQANSVETFESILEIPADIEEGNLNLLINANSKTASAFVQEYVLLERGSISGLSIFDGENAGNILSATLVLAFIVFAFIIGRRILRYKGIDQRKSILSTLAGSIMHHKRSFDNRAHYHVE